MPTPYLPRAQGGGKSPDFHYVCLNGGPTCAREAYSSFGPLTWARTQVSYIHLHVLTLKQCGTSLFDTPTCFHWKLSQSPTKSTSLWLKGQKSIITLQNNISKVPQNYKINIQHWFYHFCTRSQSWIVFMHREIVIYYFCPNWNNLLPNQHFYPIQNHL